MKAVLLFVGVLMAAPAAFANVDVNTSDDQVMDLENGAMSQEAADALTPPMQLQSFRNNNGAEIAGDVLEIIGAIAADRIGEGRRPPHRRHPGDGWGRPEQFVCYARDARGNVYRAIGRWPRNVQRRAMENCFRWARFCRAQGCHRT